MNAIGTLLTGAEAAKENTPIKTLMDHDKQMQDRAIAVDSPAGQSEAGSGSESGEDLDEADEFDSILSTLTTPSPKKAPGKAAPKASGNKRKLGAAPKVGQGKPSLQSPPSKVHRSGSRDGGSEKGGSNIVDKDKEALIAAKQKAFLDSIGFTSIVEQIDALCQKFAEPPLGVFIIEREGLQAANEVLKEYRDDAIKLKKD